MNVHDEFVVTQIRQANLAYIKSIESAANLFRESTLEPFCKENEIDFISGAGKYFFHRPSEGFFVERPAEIDSLPPDWLALGDKLEDLFFVLDRELLNGRRFGNHVRSYINIPF
jgi:hypothetical protein